MNSTEFSQRLSKIEPGSPEATVLAQHLIDDARYPARLVLARYFSHAGAAEQTKAKNVLADLGDLSLVPLARSEPMSGLDGELWAMRTMVEELAALRHRAASVLRTFLLNRRPALPSPGSPYQNFPDARVCDLAFLLLTRIFHLKLSVSEFCNLPADGRDARIREFQASRAFQSAFESQP